MARWTCGNFLLGCNGAAGSMPASSDVHFSRTETWALLDRVGGAVLISSKTETIYTMLMVSEASRLIREREAGWGEGRWGREMGRNGKMGVTESKDGEGSERNQMTTKQEAERILNRTESPRLTVSTSPVSPSPHPAAPRLVSGGAHG